MDIHKNARLTLISREELAKRVSQQGWTLKAAAAAFNVSAKTAAKWVGRYRELGREGLGDRSSRPQRSPCRTGADRVAQVEALRRERWTGLRIALTTGLSRATISRILRRRALEPHARPGTSAARDPLRARRPRRSAPSRHQENRALRRGRLPHYRPSPRTHSRTRLGIS